MKKYLFFAMMVAMVATSCTKAAYTPENQEKDKNLFAITLSEKGDMSLGGSIITLKITDNQTHGKNGYNFDYDLDGPGQLTQLAGKEDENTVPITGYLTSNTTRFLLKTSGNGTIRLRMTVSNGVKSASKTISWNVGEPKNNN